MPTAAPASLVAHHHPVLHPRSSAKRMHSLPSHNPLNRKEAEMEWLRGDYAYRTRSVI
jgi:pyrroloquinoline quinone (PQQ) biosynthesis protein C